MARSFSGSQHISYGTGGGVGAASAWTAFALARATSGNDGQIVCKRSAWGAGSNQFCFGRAGASRHMNISKDSTFAETSSLTWPSGTWARGLAACDGTSAIFNMDGSEETVTADWVTGGGTTQAVGIGRLITEASEGWEGDIAEVAIWNVKLSAGQRAALAAGAPPLQVAPESLVHYWKLTGKYSTEPDVVGGLTGTISGATATSDPRMFLPGPAYARRQGVAAGGGSVTVTPGVASLSLTSFAAAVSATQNQLVTPGQASLTTSPFAPTVTPTLNQLVTPDTLALALTAFAATVSISGNQTVTPDTRALVTSLQAPDVNAGGNMSVSPGVLSLALTGYAALVTATAHQMVSPGALALVTSPFAPVVTASNHILVVPSPASLVIATFAPLIPGSAATRYIALEMTWEQQIRKAMTWEQTIEKFATWERTIAKGMTWE